MKDYSYNDDNKIINFDGVVDRNRSLLNNTQPL